MSTLTGTWPLLRLASRRDRIKLPLWVACLTIFVPYLFVAYETVLSDPKTLAAIMGMVANPVMAIFTGPGYGLSSADADVGHGVIFASIYWLYLLLLVALMNILLVSRHTRLEEQTGRSELLRADAVGRHAPLTAALLLALAANLVLALAIAGSLIAFDNPAEDAAVVGVATALVGCVFAAVTAVTVQLSSFAGSASGLAGAVLGVAFIVRGVGDMIAPAGQHGTWLSWLSPFAWAQQTRAFVDARWWPLLVPVVVVAALLAVAYALQSRRDFGSGILGTRSGREHAPGWAGTATGFALRLHRGAIGWWLFGLALAALMYAAFTDSMVEAFSDLPPIFRELMGGADGALSGYLTITTTMFRLTLAVFALVIFGRVVAEETDGRLESVLSTRTSPRRWLGAHLLVIAAATLVAATVTGAIGGAFTAAAGDDGAWLWRGIAAALTGVPSVLVVLGIAAALYSLGVRWVVLAWLPVVLGSVISLFGDVLSLPGWARELSPFEHTPVMPASDFRLAPVLVQLAVAATLFAVAVWGVRHRDITSS